MSEWKPIRVPPFRIKMVEPIRRLPAADRWARMAEAHWNVFYLRSRDVFIDLLTDSGTGAMSDAQWAALVMGDEAYAGSQSFEALRAVVEDLTGMPYVLPVHQGRGAEHVFFKALLRPGQVVPSNTHFDTTRANIRAVGATPVDLPVPEAADPDLEAPFKGDIDVDRLARLLREAAPGQVPIVMLTVTNNALGGQPVSMENIRQTAELAHRYGARLVMDIARFAENCYFIRQREPAFRSVPLRDIARQMFSYADACLMSAKKDGLVPIGGFIATRHADVYEAVAPFLILHEGFLTYGGLAGHELAAMAVGLQEVLDEAYLAHRVGQVATMVDELHRRGIPVVRPAGGHAVYVVADRLMDHVPVEAFPGQALTVALYCAGGVRACEVGSLLMGDDERPPYELVRLAIPRRVYTDEHLAYVVRVLAAIAERPRVWPGFRVVRAPAVLRHFTAHLAPTGPLPSPTDWELPLAEGD